MRRPFLFGGIPNGPFYAEILATGSQCTQFVRKGQSAELSLWCRAHADPGLRERNADIPISPIKTTAYALLQ